MRYCNIVTRENKDSEFMNEIGEITIIFQFRDKTLPEYMLKHAHQRINIYIQNAQEFIDNQCLRIFNAMRKEHPEIDFAFQLNSIEREDVRALVKEIKAAECKYKFFMANSAFDFDTFWGLINLGVCDVSVAGPLGFCLPDIAEAARSSQVNIRCMPYLASSSWNYRSMKDITDKTPSGITRFFIRPEDIDLYSEYIDTFELMPLGKNREKVMYDIYSKDKKWVGNLNEIILYLDTNLLNSCILPNFGKRRLNCGQRCLRNGSCKICGATQALSDTLMKKQIKVKSISKIDDDDDKNESVDE